MINLYPHQSEQIEAVRQAMRSSKAVLMQSPTGSGKSVMAAAMISAARDKGSKALFVVPRRELLRQMGNTFAEFNIPHSYIAAGYGFNPHALTHIASAASLVKKISYLKPHVVFIDETHHGSTTLDKIINYYKGCGAWIIGLSATPIKLSGHGLDCWYDEMVEGKSMRWLIDNSYLSDYRAFAPSSIDLSGIRTVAGDYAKGQLAEKMEQDRVLIGNAVKHYKEHATGKLNIAYCVSVKHSQIVAEEFCDAGVQAVHIDGKTPDEERKRIIQAFARREIMVLTNCDLLTFGFDLSSNAGIDVTVEAMSDLRPTKSLALQCQKWGRVLRRKDFPALIFDHASNIQNADGTPNHGLPCEDREWKLEGREKRSGPKDRELAVRECPKCYRCHPPAPACVQCGYVYPIESRSIKEIEGELKEIEKKAARKQRGLEEWQCKTLEDWRELAKQRGHKQGWAWMRFNTAKKRVRG